MSKGWTFGKLPIDLMTDGEISPAAKVYYAYLSFRQGTDPDCWPSDARAAADLGMSSRTIIRLRKELESARWIEVKRTLGRVNRYNTREQPLTQVSRADGPTTDTDVTPTTDTDVTPTTDTGVTLNETQITRKIEREGSDKPVEPSGDIPDSWRAIEESPRPDERTTPLSPTTAEELIFWERLSNNARYAGRAPPRRFPTMECKEKFGRIVARMNGRLEEALDILFEQGITSIVRAVNYLGGIADRWEQEGAQKEAKADGRRFG